MIAVQAYFLDCFSGLAVGAKTGAGGLLGWTLGAGAETGGGFWFVLPGDVGDNGFWKGLKPNPALDAVKDKQIPKRDVINLAYIRRKLLHKYAFLDAGFIYPPLFEARKKVFG